MRKCAAASEILSTTFHEHDVRARRDLLFSFPVRLFHCLEHAGLAGRTPDSSSSDDALVRQTFGKFLL
jgi:hypothetical protein